MFRTVVHDPSQYRSSVEDICAAPPFAWVAWAWFLAVGYDVAACKAWATAASVSTDTS
jgi:hypothetical protein